jgi:uncharacterized protein YcbX
MVNRVGEIQSLWRYPVRSMRGETLDAIEVTSRGVVGDRCYGIVDVEEDCGAEASYVPTRWSGLLSASAAFQTEPRVDAAPPPISIRFDDGSTKNSDEADLAEWLSERLGQAARLWCDTNADGASVAGGKAEATGDAYSADESAAPEGAPGWGYDRAPIHLVTTASFQAASAIHDRGQFVAERFRPNIVIDTGGGNQGFLESTWIGRTLAIGDELRLEVIAPTERCSMPTMPQGDLALDRRILSTVAKHNEMNMGIYARVATPGHVRRGDRVELT